MLRELVGFGYIEPAAVVTDADVPEAHFRASCALMTFQSKVDFVFGTE